MTETSPSKKIRRMRKLLHDTETDLVAKLGPPPSSIMESYTNITLQDGHVIKAKMWTPTRGVSEERPLIVLFHGGAFQAGSYEMCTVPGRDFALAFQAAVIAPEYRLAPEHPFPRVVMDGVETVRWIAENAESQLHANPTTGFIVGGLSAGGNIAAVVAHQCSLFSMKHAITGSFLGIPHLMTEDIVPERYAELFKSRKENEKHHPYISGMEATFVPNYFGENIRSPLFSPVNAPLEELARLPRTFIQICELDGLRDDGVIYAKVLQEAGVECRLYCQEGQDHQALTIWYDESKGSPRALKDETMKGIAWLLRTEWTGGE